MSVELENPNPIYELIKFGVAKRAERDIYTRHECRRCGQCCDYEPDYVNS